jgi:hypothetical protein
VNSSNYVIDTKRPTATITITDDNLTAGETTTVFIDFSEDVNASSFTNADLTTIENGTVSTKTDVNTTRISFVFTPTVDVTDATNIITVGTSWSDTVGNAPSADVNSSNYVIDTKRPTATITITDDNLTAGETTTVFIDFSEDVNASSFTNADLTTIENGTVSTKTDVNTTRISFVFTPTVDVTDATNIITVGTSWSDTVGNAPSADVNSSNYVIDTKRPTATITITDDNLTAGETTTVFIDFSEDVNASSFTNADLTTIENGTVSTKTDVNTTRISFVFTPTVDVTDATNIITVGTSWSDTVGNAPSADVNSSNYVIDTKRPTATITITDDNLTAGETTTVFIDFSEDVNASSFTNADLTTIENGTVSTKTDVNTTRISFVFTPTVDVTDATNIITVGTSWSDTVGNAPSADVNSSNYVIDTKRPTATITITDDNLTAGETTTVFIDFSEDVNASSFTNADLTTIENGTVSTKTDVNTTRISFVFTPTVDVTDATNIITVGTSWSDTVGNAPSADVNSSNYVINTKRPTATITITDDNLTAGETTTVFIDFSEDVNASSFTNADLTTIENGTVSTKTDVNTTRISFVFTPTVDVTDATNIITVGTSWSDTVGNAPSADVNSSNYVIDTKRPTATITITDDNLTAGETTTVFIDFSEDVNASSFTNADLTTIENGTVSTKTDVNTTRISFVFTPTVDVTDATNIITVGTSWSDTVGNAPSADVNSSNYVIDTKRPTATITITDDNLTAGETTTVFIDFSEDVNASSFTNADLTTIENGTVSTKTDVNTTRISFVFTPTVDVTDATNIITVGTSWSDTVGNAPSADVNSSNYVIDTKRPTATITITDDNLTAGETTTVFIDFSEDVNASSFTNADLTTIENGTVSTKTDVNTTRISFVFTPTVDVTDATNIITVGTSWSDTVGNAPSADVNSSNYVIDTKRPTATITITDDNLTAGETTTVFIDFSEDVNASSFTNADLTTIENGTVSTKTDVNTTRISFVFTPTVDVTDATNIITVGTSWSDTVGNAPSADVNSSNYVIDTKRPTATITITDDNLTAGETTTVFIDFSEDVNASSFTNADLTTIENGTVSTKTDVNTTRISFVFTPTVDVTDATNIITVGTSWSDTVGNAPSADVNSSNYVIDTKRPTATITITDDNLTAGETTTVFIDFSEDVNASSFTNADLTTIENGTVSTKTDVNTTRISFVFTPTVDVTDATNIITVGTSWSDTVGNAPSADVNSSNYVIDTKRPTISTTAFSTSGVYTNGDDINVTFTFSEAVTVTGTPKVELTLDSPKDANYSTGSGTTELIFTYTVGTDIDTDGFGVTANTLVLNGGTIKDSAGNTATITHRAISTTDIVGQMQIVSKTPADDSTNQVVDEASDVTITFADIGGTIVGQSGKFVEIWQDEATDINVSKQDTNTVNVGKGDDKMTSITLGGHLAYGKSFYIKVDAGAFKSSGGAPSEGITTNTGWNFTTSATGGPCGCAQLDNCDLDANLQ